MSWGCPHQINDECAKLKKKCEPFQKGCVLEKKNLKIMEYQSGIELTAGVGKIMQPKDRRREKDWLNEYCSAQGSMRT